MPFPDHVHQWLHVVQHIALVHADQAIFLEGGTPPEHPMHADLIHEFILLVLLPAWLFVGLADWWCHRRAHVEITPGPKESAIHLLLSVEAAAAVLPALLLDIDAAVLAVMIVAFIAHEVTTTIDLHIAFPARAFTITESRIHDFLTAIPFAGLCLVLATHADQAAALIGVGPQAADWTLRWKDPALPLSYLIGWSAAALAINVLPFIEEFLRGVRAQKSRSH